MWQMWTKCEILILSNIVRNHLPSPLEVISGHYLP